MNLESGEVLLHFEEDNLPQATEIADFLFLLSAAYSAALMEFRPDDCSKWPANRAEIENRIKKKIKSLSPSERASLFSQKASKSEIQLRRISVNSPMDMVLFGGLLLVAAVILSGGEVNLSVLAVKVQFKLKAIGEGIAKLRRALNPSAPSQIGYGIKKVAVTLSKDEYQHLLAASTKGTGGFQGLIADLKLRINKKTRRIYLDSREIEFIVKYGSNPKKGGWQGRLKKIFGRHFGL